MVSTFRGIVDFFARLGIYDVILPFLLVFTIVFAALEKTRVFGMDKIAGQEYTKKNLNSMVAFVIAFLVVASSRLVAIINQSVAQIVVILIIMFCILLVIGFFAYSEKEEVILSGGAKTFFMAITIISIIAIFFNAIGWLDPITGYVLSNLTGNVLGSIILIGIVVGFMYYITKTPDKSE
jgi:small-conductance mechanosensitive channel